MHVMVDQVANAGGRTWLQWPPPSVVTYTNPSSEPVQMMLSLSGEKAIVDSVSNISSPVMSALIGPPERSCLLLSLRVRSGLITFHGRTPGSSDSNSTFPPTRSSFGLCGANTAGRCHQP